MIRPPARTASLPARVLVDLPNWLGDLVMALPALDRVVSANSDGTTIVLARPSTRRLVAALFPSVTVEATPRGESAISTGSRIRRVHGKMDVGLTFRNACRAKITIWRAATRTVGSNNQGGGLLLSRSPRVDRSRHQVHDQDRLLAELGLEGVDPDWRPPLSPEMGVAGRSAIDGLIPRDGVSVGLAPGVAGGEVKRWAPAMFGRLAGRLLEDGFSPLVLVGPGEGDLAKRVVEASGRDLPVLGLDRDAAGLMELVSGLKALVGNDSGACHIGALVGIAVVALFGPTDPRRTAPRGDRIHVCQLPVPCVPCCLRSCRLMQRVCLDDLQVETVLQAVRSLVGSRTEAPCPS